MSKRKQTKAIHKVIYKLFRQLSRIVQKAALGFSNWLMRTFLVLGRKQRHPANAKAGFVLPTVTLLLLVVALVVAAILFRAGSRTTQVIGTREEQVIYNAATPAIERAKAKLEYLFLKDKRFPGGPPSDEMLLAMLTNEPVQNGTSLTYKLNPNPYVLGDELQQPNTSEGYLDINGGGRDPAWSYQTDVDGDGSNETVIYAISLKTRDGNITLEGNKDSEKAPKLVVRNGPITTTDITNPVCRNLTQNQNQNQNQPTTAVRPVNESDWFPSGSAVLRKTFQVDAIVISTQEGTSRTVATLEFQQDRQLDRGNKWGAWFRNDLEIFPGSNNGQGFRWNGAMYTAGSLIVGDPHFTSYLISSPGSCFYTKDASELKVYQNNQIPPNANNPNFQGQFIAGKMGDNSTNGGSVFHVMKADDNPNDNRGETQFNSDTDSVNGGIKPNDVALDPVYLFTQEKPQSRNTSDASNSRATDDRFYTNEAEPGRIGYFNARKRTLTRAETAPFVDDTYRADDRYGPKPNYGRNQEVVLDNSGKKNGTNITNAEDKKILTNNTVDALDTEYRALGLDGYWERRAWASGLRVIVGERLQLGNPFGWVNSDLNANGNRNDSGETDPLYQANSCGTDPNRCHESLQRRTLRDNLAAVQGTVVYKARFNSGSLPTPAEEPIACIATTAHPGTQQTISRSKNFNAASDAYGSYTGAPDRFYSDFFTGLGTNGWEYSAPPPVSVLRGGGDWTNALNNLANFAGDYQNVNNSGAFPPVQASGGNRVYPHPYLRMWGNFSNLKRALSGDYNESIADKTYLQTAACTLGMLAYNVKYFNDYNYGSDAGNLNSLAGKLNELSDGSNANGEIRVNGTNLDIFRNASDPPTTIAIQALSPDVYIDLLGTAPEARLARRVAMKEQIARDRLFGFQSVTPTTIPTFGQNPNNYTYTLQHVTSYTYGGITYNKDVATETATTKKTLALSCNFRESAPNGNNFFGFGAPGGTTEEERFIKLAVSLCPTQPKFPALYYLFPDSRVNGHNRTNNQPTTEPYITPSPLPDFPENPAFNVVTINTLADRVRPKQNNSWSGCSDTAWCLPTRDSNNTTNGDNDFGIVIPGTSGTNPNRWVSIIDNALYNGREMMAVRTLDIDLAQLADKNNNNIRPTDGDYWLPASGIVYAFREDAVREDAISRPRNAGWGSCSSENNIRTQGGCWIIANPTANPQDPPISDDKNISPKPVDYFPDPDRRPHSFRLRNGRDISRNFPNTPTTGLTFVSDNPVYIQGDFNFHSTDGNTNNLEEFTDTLRGDWSNFYTRQARDLSTQFARPRTDRWRPAEILADAITILSDDFQEGSIDRGIINDTDGGVRTGNAPNGRYSFRATNGPDGTNNNGPGSGWVLENGLVINSTTPQLPTVPIKISRNGNPIYCTAGTPVNSFCPIANQREYGSGGESYRSINTDFRDWINEARQTRVNATLISGIVPSRINQSYGGFHNFPRFIENWGGKDLNISGSFVQLNFSTYATGPFEKNQWQPASSDPQAASNVEFIMYYNAPNRRWGYDVGLQYAAAGAVAQRFVQPPASRSEFYRELKGNDPYICQLRRVGNFDRAADTECPQ